MSNDTPYMGVKVSQTTTPGTTCPTLYEECVGALTSYRFITCARACKTGPMVYRPYPRRLESLTVCRMSLQRQHFLLSYLRTLSVGRAGT